jgi:zinc protease
MRRGLFGESSYGLFTLGVEETVQSLKVGEVKNFHARLAVPNNCALAIFGDVKAEAVRAAVEKEFGTWKKSGELEINGGRASRPSELKRVVETRDKKQAVLVLGFAGSTIFDADRYPLELLQESCSDLGSRLFMRIREKLGLAYYVGAQNFLGLAPGYFAFYAGTDPHKAEKVEQELLAEAEALRANGLTEEELKRSKAKVVGQKKIARQDLGSYAMNAALDELYGLGYAYSDQEDAKYEAVTAAETKAVAEKFLRKDAIVIALIRPQE